ncbi:MAG: DNA polymerase III subunit epsilon [Gammaproteobacteria bacterium]|nr:DNA polymerase III subunit epsilon [Gammaproteobacteria bacterium]
MRQVVLDTETTGLDPTQGHRIIEIGCIELSNRRKTDRFLHQYLNPERDIEEGASDVHGIRTADLADKPLFRDVASAFIEFVRGSEVIIHNAPFDVEFIDMELRRLGADWGSLQDYCAVTDTLALARELHPGQKNSLDALCTRYGVDNSERDLHGALLDADLLAEVYLAMTGGQASLHLDDSKGAAAGAQQLSRPRPLLRSARLRTVRPAPEELAAHERRLEDIERLSGGRCIWRRLGE